MRLDDLPTPQVLIDRGRAIRNIERVQQMASAAGIRLRPHAKTHKSPVVARWQIERGAVGVCCAKLGEAEVFAEAGIEDMRLPYPLHPVNAERVIKLLDRTHLSFIVYDLDVARRWSRALHQRGRTVDILVTDDI